MTNTIEPYFNEYNESETVLMTVPELAEYLGIGKNLAYDLLKTGTIKGFRIVSNWKVCKAAVNKYIYKESGLL